MTLSDIWVEGHPVFGGNPPEFLIGSFFRKQRWGGMSQRRLHPETIIADPITGLKKNYSPFYSVDFMGEFCMN